MGKLSQAKKKKKTKHICTSSIIEKKKQKNRKTVSINWIKTISSTKKKKNSG